MNLAKNIKRLREANNFTQQEFSNLIGVSRSTISKWERNLSEPPIDIINLMADLFKVTVDELTRPYTSDQVSYSTNIKDAKRSINSNAISPKRNKILFIVPFMNFVLLLLVITSLLVVLVTAYIEYKDQDNQTRLVYSNIKSVSLKIYYPDDDTEDIKMNLSNESKEYSLLDYQINIDNTSIEINKKIKLSILVQFKNGYFSDLSRTRQLSIINSIEYIVFQEGFTYPYFIHSGTYSFKFYIENEMGYLEAFCKN